MNLLQFVHLTTLDDDDVVAVSAQITRRFAGTTVFRALKSVHFAASKHAPRLIDRDLAALGKGGTLDPMTPTMQLAMAADFIRQDFDTVRAAVLTQFRDFATALAVLNGGPDAAANVDLLRPEYTFTRCAVEALTGLAALGPAERDTINGELVTLRGRLSALLKELDQEWSGLYVDNHAKDFQCRGTLELNRLAYDRARAVERIGVDLLHTSLRKAGRLLGDQSPADLQRENARALAVGTEALTKLQGRKEVA
jgi:hypothetical protein